MPRFLLIYTSRWTRQMLISIEYYCHQLTLESHSPPHPPPSSPFPSSSICCYSGVLKIKVMQETLINEVVNRYVFTYISQFPLLFTVILSFTCVMHGWMPRMQDPKFDTNLQAEMKKDGLSVGDKVNSKTRLWRRLPWCLGRGALCLGRGVLCMFRTWHACMCTCGRALEMFLLLAAISLAMRHTKALAVDKQVSVKNVLRSTLVAGLRCVQRRTSIA